MKTSLLATVALAAITLVGLATPSHAALVTQFIEGNDCGNPNCVANESGTFSNTQTSGSPFIIKFKADGTVEEINETLFPTITGLEFDFTPDLTGELTSGSWTYTPGEGDPSIRFWTGKGGPDYNFFYFDGPDADALADVVTSGDWSTPINPANDKGFGLSHISFYDTSTPPNEVPEPATLALFGMGLLGLGVMARRRKKA